MNMKICAAPRFIVSLSYNGPSANKMLFVNREIMVAVCQGWLMVHPEWHAWLSVWSTFIFRNEVSKWRLE